MIAVDDKFTKDRASVPLDPWADWKPQWTGKKQTPHDLQERHSPTERVNVRLTAERRAQQSQRRMVDARLWENMTAPQQDAAIEIAIAFEMIGRGMGYVTNNWQRVPGCRGPSHVVDAHARMIRFYIEWAQMCAKRKISHSMVVDVLCFGFTCRMIDRDRRLKNGAARENLMAGVSLYCELRGWQ